jgi:type 1 glutamine amidotransferase
MLRFALVLFAVFSVSHLASGKDAKPAATKPLQVLWCTGGASHDYKGLRPILTKGIQKQAGVPIDFTPSTDPNAWAKEGFADKYDVLVLFFTAHDPAGKAIVDNLAKTIYAGKPTVVIHGTLHSFRELNADRDAYCEAIGLTSVKHDKAKALVAKKVSQHWITADWPADWTTGSDELYENVKFWPNATPLLTAYSDTSKKDHVVAWINHYGKGRVFGTTLGHGKPTTDMESYHKLLANGLLWVCGHEKQ